MASRWGRVWTGQGAGSARCAQGAVSGWWDCGTWCHEAVPADRRSQLVQGLRAWPLPSLSLPYHQKADGIDSRNSSVPSSFLSKYPGVLEIK